MVYGIMMLYAIMALLAKTVLLIMIRLSKTAES